MILRDRYRPRLRDESGCRSRGPSTCNASRLLGSCGQACLWLWLLCAFILLLTIYPDVSNSRIFTVRRAWRSEHGSAYRLRSGDDWRNSSELNDLTIICDSICLPRKILAGGTQRAHNQHTRTCAVQASMAVCTAWLAIIGSLIPRSRHVESRVAQICAIGISTATSIEICLITLHGVCLLRGICFRCTYRPNQPHARSMQLLSFRSNVFHG